MKRILVLMAAIAIFCAGCLVVPGPRGGLMVEPVPPPIYVAPPPIYAPPGPPRVVAPPPAMIVPPPIIIR